MTKSTRSGISARRIFLATSIVLAAFLVSASASPQALARRIVDLPVSFQVTNTNTSLVPCASDGATYTVRGHLVGPRSQFVDHRPEAVTLYLHSLDSGEWYWHLREIEDYDYALQMAEAGRVSLTIDRLGYDSSGHPIGFLSCVGSQADIAHQIIQELRNGQYAVQGLAPFSFLRVALAGHSISGLIAHVEAYSYEDVNALIVMGWTDHGTTNDANLAFAQAAATCAAGGENAEEGGPPGYAYFDPTDEQFKSSNFFDAEPQVLAAAVERHNRNPCGDMDTIPQGIASDDQNLGTITVPVLLVCGQEDRAFQGCEDQETLYTGSNDVTRVMLPGTGHFMALERTAADLFRPAVSGWLGARGF